MGMKYIGYDIKHVPTTYLQLGPTETQMQVVSIEIQLKDIMDRLSYVIKARFDVGQVQASHCT